MDEPVVIIGAPRSGTNMLRDALDRFPQIVTWPCDEINYIWRHGNIRYPSDEFVPDLATTPVVEYIRAQFSKLSRHSDEAVVLEKTCANSLRVGFVDRVLPNARYIFIRRNGLDAVASAMKRWTADLDPGYIYRKARYVPPADLPYYASRYLWNRVYRWFSGTERLAFWGPQLSGMQELMERYSLVEVCGLQWQRCVNSAAAALDAMPESKVLDVSYEKFVVSPVEEMYRVVEFLGLEKDEVLIQEIGRRISPASVGNWRNDLAEDDVLRLKTLIGATLDRHGYN
jgi:Sulfotransferase family